VNRAAELFLRSLAVTVSLAAAAVLREPVSLALFLAVTPAVLLVGFLSRRLEERMFRRPSSGSKPSATVSPLIRLLLDLIEAPERFALGICVGLVGTAWYGGVSAKTLLLAGGAALLAATMATLLASVRARRVRLLIAGAVLMALVGAAIALEFRGDALAGFNHPAAALVIVVTGLVLYLLVFLGRSAESEFEIGMVCVLLGAGFSLLPLPPAARILAVILPVGLFVAYCDRMRRGIIVFKSLVRGMGFEQSGDLRNALISYRQTLGVEPNHAAALAGNWRVHARLSPEDLGRDPSWGELIDPVVCLERARKLIAKLAGEPVPPVTRSQDADGKPRGVEPARLIELAAARRPDLPLVVAAERMALALEIHDDPGIAWGIGADATDAVPPRLMGELPPHELDALFRLRSMMLRDIRLITFWSPGLDDPSFVVSSLAAVEARLRQVPGDAVAAGFKPLLVERLSANAIAKWQRIDPEDGLAWLDWNAVAERARALLAESGRWLESERLFELTERGPATDRLALRRDRAELLTAWELAVEKGSSLAAPPGPSSTQVLEAIVQDGELAGPNRLSEADGKAFSFALRTLADRAERASQPGRAAELLGRLAATSRVGPDTLQRLLGLLDLVGRRVEKLRPIETALAYELPKAEREWWQRERARLYDSLTVEEVRARREELGRLFDASYCLERAGQAFDRQAEDAEVRRWVELAELGDESAADGVRFLKARLDLRAGRLDEALAGFEQVASKAPPRFESEAERDRRFAACRLAAEVCLDRLDQPARAVGWLEKYERSSKSGADTLYRLGLAHERAGNRAAARKWFDMVLVYPSHPLAERAKESLARLAGA
jgi:hypothetical protein